MIAFDPKGDIKDGTLTLYTYKDGKRTLLTGDKIIVASST